MHNNFTADGSVTATAYRKTVRVIARGDFGGGTLSVLFYDPQLADYILIDSYTSGVAKEITVGVGRTYKIQLASSTDPDLDVVYSDIDDNQLATWQGY